MLQSLKTLVRPSLRYLPFQAPLIRAPFSKQTLADKLNNKKSHQTHYTESVATSNTVTPKGPAVEELINSDKGLSTYMTKIYKTTGASFATYLAGGYLLSGTALAFMNPIAYPIVGLVGAIGCYMGFKRVPMTMTESKLPGGKIEQVWTNPLSRKLLFSGMIGSISFASLPLFVICNAINPSIIPTAAAIAMMVMGGSTIYSLRAPSGAFSHWRSGLYGGLMGLIGINLLGLLSYMTIGPNIFLSAITSMSTYASLGLFTAFQIFDTHEAVEDYKAGNYDYLDHTISMFLNFVNIFKSLVQILMRFRND